MIEFNILRSLLDASCSKGEDELSCLVLKIFENLPSKLCSLWRLNTIANVFSVCARECYSNSGINSKNTYIHPVEGSIKEYIINKCISENISYVDVPSIFDDPYSKLNKAQDNARALGLKRLICIPIPKMNNNKLRNIESYSDIDMILNIYVEDSADFSPSCAEIIRDFFSFANSRLMLFEKEKMSEEIVEIYKQKASKDLSSILHPIISRIIKKYCSYEACSIFILDPFSNRLLLSQTTGLKGGISRSDVYYFVGQGTTGTIAKEKKRFIADPYNENNSMATCNHRWQETTANAPESFMGIPIMSPSRSNELVGVIRFVNKINPVSGGVDCFSEDDCSLVEYACNLIALYMEFDRSQIVRKAFAMQIAHEMLAPAVAIRISANRLQEKWNLPSFPINKVNSYLGNIQDQSELQMTLTDTIRYAWEDINLTKSKKYRIERRNLREIIHKARSIVIPIARREKLTFDNIKITGSIPNLYVDEVAFEQIFFNLLTNAIKYRIRDKSKEFSVNIKLRGFDNYEMPISINDPDFFTDEESIVGGDAVKVNKQSGFLIEIEDFGSGIDEEEKDMIFIFGYRKRGIERTNVRGLGMGLSVVKKILNDFYGEIWVSSLAEPTVFNIFLPERLLSRGYTKDKDWLGEM